jgi:hypothetical protein
MSIASADESVGTPLKTRYRSVSYAKRDAVVRRFLDEVLSFVGETVGVADLRAAWDEFHAWLGHGVDVRAADCRLFLSWYVFHWHSELKLGSERPNQPSLAERYLQDRHEQHSSDMHLLVRSAVGTPLDFYEVLYLPEFGRYYVKSLFLGYQHSFGFEELPPGLELGNVYLAKIVHLFDDQGVLAGVSSALNPYAKVAIGSLRRNLIKTRATDFTRDFWLFDADVFNLYRDLTQPLG